VSFSGILFISPICFVVTLVLLNEISFRHIPLTVLSYKAFPQPFKFVVRNHVASEESRNPLNIQKITGIVTAHAAPLGVLYNFRYLSVTAASGVAPFAFAHKLGSLSPAKLRG